MKKFIIILMILLCTSLFAVTEKDAESAISSAEKNVRDASKDIPFQFQFNPDIKDYLSQADANIFIAKNDLANKKYSQAILNANSASTLIEEAVLFSKAMTEKKEIQINDRLQGLKKKSNNEMINEIIFEAENLFQQKNYFECINL